MARKLTSILIAVALAVMGCFLGGLLGVTVGREAATLLCTSPDPGTVAPCLEYTLAGGLSVGGLGLLLGLATGVVVMRARYRRQN